MRLVASAADGATGIGGTSIRVTQPLHAEPWLATHLTVGDEVDVPVAVHDETDAAMRVSASLRLSPGLVAVGPVEAAVEVGAHGTAAHVFRVRAVAAGEARATVLVASGRGGPDLSDAVERVVTVRPLARAVVETRSGTLAAGLPWTPALPALAEGVPSERRVSFYASPLADTLGGFEGLIACPHG